MTRFCQMLAPLRQVPARHKSHLLLISLMPGQGGAGAGAGAGVGQATGRSAGQRCFARLPTHEKVKMMASAAKRPLCFMMILLE
jgi:hypothetical protein